MGRGQDVAVPPNDEAAGAKVLAMNGPSWDRIKGIFQQALDRPAHERAEWLQAVCGTDSALKAEVESLLNTHREAGSFGERPAIELLDQLALEADSRMFESVGRVVHRGDRLGVYEIQSLLGAGGMGEVYRARDTQLGRDVAIKVLPPAFVTDLERLARFEREARLLASLNHPHIGAIYGIEHVDGGRALVLELIEGETLADRIGRGPMSFAEALPIAQQIAEALEAAHEKGIVHRDLKPANIKIAPSGGAKVLDFGLAKMEEGGGPDVSHSPTVTISEAHGRVLLGTVAYMSPEQVRSQRVDKRADIWAFGCVLYEMLTGRAAFPGNTVSDHIAGILEREPVWMALPATTPPVVQRLLKRCLEKDAKQRLHDIADARIELDEAVAGAATSGAGGSHEDAPARRTFPGRRHVVAVGVIVSVAAVVAVWTAGKFAPSRESPVAGVITRFVVQPPAGVLIDEFDMSPDGRALVYLGVERGVERMFLRRLDQYDGAPVAGTEGAFTPFFSADSQWVGFFANRKLQKVNVAAGSGPIVLCSGLDDGAGDLGAAWQPDGTAIVFGTIEHGLQRVSAEGGKPSVVTSVDRTREIDHHSPEVLPGGQTLLFAIHQGEDRFSIAVQSIASGQRKVIIESGFDAHYLPSGHIVFARGSAILAVPFDLKRLLVTGEPVTLVENVANISRGGFGGFRVSRSGSLAFQPGGEPLLAGRVLTWVDRSGAETPLPISPRAFMFPRVSPDGKTVAFTVADHDRRDMWTYDLAADKLTRLTSEGDNQNAQWTPDGRRLSYTSTRAGVQHLVWQAPDGRGTSESLLMSRNRVWVGPWTRDNRILLYVEDPPTDKYQIFALRLDGEPRSQPLTKGPASHGFPSLSPDGRWLAFTSTETGETEVYVAAFPALEPHFQVTVEGGRAVLWSHDGRELFYRHGSGVFAVAVDTSHGFSAGKPVRLFEGTYVSNLLDYGMAPDGRFLMVKQSKEEQAPPHINVVLNWVDELVRRVPSVK